ncbi:MAG: shikimate dehydrogenase [Pseudomonadota bacterium]
MFASAAIWGYPATYSRSPLIHGLWLHQHKISGAYLRRDVTIDAMPDLLHNFKNLDLKGVNLTLPLKEAASAYVRLDDVAAKLQAVNTLWLEDDILYGTNTDVAGFLGSLDEQAPQWRSYLENVVVLGSGGAAKAVICGLLQAGAERITIVNRNTERAEALVRLFGTKTHHMSWDKVDDALMTADMLVNTTSLGMMGQPPLALDINRLPLTAIVADIVYVPLETNLLKQARAAGLATVDGLGMLLHQAVPGFTKWFGVTPRVTPELREAIAADLRG